MRLRAVAALGLLVGAAPEAGAQLLRGRVLDADTRQAVPQAAVVALAADGDTVARARTDSVGAFVLELRASGALRVRAERAGYQPTESDTVVVEPSQAVDVELLLATRPLALPALTVTGRAQARHIRSLARTGFYQRERLGGGRFVRREEIERWQSHDINDVLLRTAPMTLRAGRGGIAAAVFSRHRSAPDCLPRVVINGFVTMAGTAASEVMSPRDVLALELYANSAAAPVEYRGTADSCGIIVIWTRTGPDDDRWTTAP